MRAVGYFRVSSAEQVEGYSLQAQAEAYDARCASEGWESVRTFTEPGVSAYTDKIAKRPAFQAMMDFALSGQCDLVVVHKLDRFARNQALLHTQLGRLKDAGVRFVSIHESIDLDTVGGMILYSTLGMMAEMYSRNLSGEVKKGKKVRAAHGLHASRLPFGARLNSDGLGEPDPDTYPLLLYLFEQAADGRSGREIAADMNARGIRSPSGGLWSQVYIAQLLRHRYYLGEVDGMAGKHAPLWEAFPVDLWHRAAALRDVNRVGSVRRDRQRHALTGLGRCAECGFGVKFYFRMRGGNYTRQVRSRCRGRIEHGICTARLTRHAVYEEQVGEYLERVKVPTLDRAMRGIERRDVPAVDVGRLRAQIGRAQELFFMGEWDRERFLAERNRLQKLIDEAGDVRPERADVRRTLELLRHAGQVYAGTTPEQRNDLLRTFFRAVPLEEKRIGEPVWVPSLAEILGLRAGATG